MICRVLGVSTSGYYDWKHRLTSPPTARVTQTVSLITEIRAIHDKFGYYGAPRIHAELRAREHRVGRKRVARLMRANGICARRGKLKSRPRSAPTRRRPEIGDLVKRDFHADVPNSLWFTDITQIRTSEGWLYAAVIVDAFNREVISWAVAGRETPNTVMNAFREAIQIRKPSEGCIIHSDRGYQFTSDDWSKIASTRKMSVSIGERKSCYDNATMESWFASLKTEEIYPKGQPETRREAGQRLFRYIWSYNTERLHSSLGYASPRDYAESSSICP